MHKKFIRMLGILFIMVHKRKFSWLKHLKSFWRSKVYHLQEQVTTFTIKKVIVPFPLKTNPQKNDLK